ncbi:phage late control D family protein [Altererythrobacter sp. CC-YST694]|uniref:contractile injection system protein, VgrG/Pvc8 family n=1 Tax=Altererythrobacter sp. CC-YST694 TaxID=2755038 RepID=UPI001D01CA13|nr:contractile injection system protein, VgrG/Pvc8 family [Altererythrobacter sp. CC-YST694]MCB5423943.1 phage late control D family protein [Altererythrobacter sp. CC-YST694]
MADLPFATWLVMLDGKDMTDKLNPRLLSASITEKRAEEADQLDIVLQDADGLLELPTPGVELEVSMGWLRGAGLPLGLVHKGRFRVDEAKWSGALDIVTIRARSADFTDAFRVRRERSFVGKSVRDVLSTIAGENGLGTAIDAALGGKTIPALGPGAKSDAALLMLLGKRFDAMATVKAGKLLFAPIGKGKAPTGGTIPAITIDRAATNGAEYERIERENYGGVIAVWHDKASGRRQEVQVGGSGKSDTKPKRIRKTFANEADARQAAEGEDSRLTRAKAKLSFTLPLGRPDIYPETPVTVTGFKAEINARKWVVAESVHTMDGGGGLVSKLVLEATR